MIKHLGFDSFIYSGKMYIIYTEIPVQCKNSVLLYSINSIIVIYHKLVTMNVIPQSTHCFNVRHLLLIHEYVYDRA